jgi:hypothetical protein
MCVCMCVCVCVYVCVYKLYVLEHEDNYKIVKQNEGMSNILRIRAYDSLLFQYNYSNTI